MFLDECVIEPIFVEGWHIYVQVHFFKLYSITYV